MSCLETLVCLLVALIVLGPKRLPAAARKVGHWVGLFRRASEEFQRQIMMMDQTVNERVNRAVQNLDTLVPADETFSADLPPDAPMPYPYSDPPPGSPDDALSAEPVSGGLPPAPDPLPPPEVKPAAHQPYGGKRTPAPPKPRSLGLSPTPPQEVTRG